jgi:hypothetical protein
MRSVVCGPEGFDGLLFGGAHGIAFQGQRRGALLADRMPGGLRNVASVPAAQGQVFTLRTDCDAESNKMPVSGRGGIPVGSEAFPHTSGLGGNTGAALSTQAVPASQYTVFST